MSTVRISLLSLLLAGCFIAVLSGCSDPVPDSAKNVGADASSEDQICAAATAGDLGKVKMLIESDPTLIDALDSNGRTPLHFAAAFGRNDVVKYLMEKGASAGTNDDNGESSIAAAIGSDHKDTAQIMIDFSKNAKPVGGAAPQP